MSKVVTTYERRNYTMADMDDYEYPDPGLLTKLQELGVDNPTQVFYELRSYLLKECKLWEGPYGDYYMMCPTIIGADK